MATMGGEAMLERRLDRKHAIQPLGRDAQVDAKALVIVPDDFARIDPFLALAEDWFSSPGFDWHPHRGIETVTTVIDGALEHGDNHGNTGVLEPGAVQWMTAGEGIIHRELAYRDEHAHTLQLWVNLPSSHKMADARYQDLALAGMGRLEARGVSIRLVSGRTMGELGPAQNHWPITGMQIVLEPGCSVTVDLPGRDRAFLYVMSGTLAVGSLATVLTAPEVGWTDPVGMGPSTLELAATHDVEEVRLVLYSGEPIREPVVAYGPFVMNSREQIEQAFRDLRAGRFGAVPALGRIVDAPRGSAGPDAEERSGGRV